MKTRVRRQLDGMRLDEDGIAALHRAAEAPTGRFEFGAAGIGIFFTAPDIICGVVDAQARSCRRDYRIFSLGRPHHAADQGATTISP
jgi:hypothetical protein